jgi:SulP family sulfate permease
MSEWHAFVGEFTAPKSDAAVMVVTFLLTVVVDLTVAIQVGVVLAALLFIRRMSEVTNVRMFTRELSDDDDRADYDANAASHREIPDGVVVFEINGPFFFGAAQIFKERLERVLGQPKVLILRLRNVPAIDSTGLHLLREVVRRARQDKTLVLLADVHAQPMFALVRSNVIAEIGQEALFSNLDEALNRARAHLGLPAVPPPEWAVPTVRREQPALPERRKTRRE